MADLEVAAVVLDSRWNQLDELSRWDNLTMVHRACDVGTGALDVPNPTRRDRELLVEGNTIQLHHAGRVLQSGILNVRGEDEGSAKASKPSWVDPMDYLAKALTLPNPVLRPGVTDETGSGPAEYDVRSGFPSTVALGLIGDNVGPSAIPQFRAPGIEIGPDELAGEYLPPQYFRDEILLDAVRRVCLPHGAVAGVRTTDRRHVVEVWQARDLSSRVQFAKALGNSVGGIWSMEAPAATHVIVQGPEGPNRIRFMVTTPESLRQAERWGRPFVIVMTSSTQVRDDPAATLEAMRQEGLAKLAESGETVKGSIEIVDGIWTFGEDYRLGDLVGWQPEALADPLVYPVRELTEEWSSDRGHEIRPLIGDYGATGDLAVSLTVKALTRTLAALANHS